MSKGAGKQTVTQKLDPQTEAYQKLVYQRAQEAANQPYTPYQGQTVAGTSPLSGQAVGGWQQGAQLGNLGMGALGGDQAALAHFQNPYQQQVLDQIRGQYGDLNSTAQMGINDQATAAGAFGGSRQGVASGVASADIAKGLGQQMANFTYQGFNDAQQRALSAANLGMGANQSLFGAGDYFRNVQQQQLGDQENRFNQARDWDLRNLDVLKSGMTGTPYGSSQSQPLTKNLGAGLLGGAASGAAIGSAIPGIGTAVGAGVGGLLGIFG